MVHARYGYFTRVEYDIAVSATRSQLTPAIIVFLSHFYFPRMAEKAAPLGSKKNSSDTATSHLVVYIEYGSFMTFNPVIK